MYIATLFETRTQINHPTKIFPSVLFLLISLHLHLRTHSVTWFYGVSYIHKQIRSNPYMMCLQHLKQEKKKKLKEKLQM